VGFANALVIYMEVLMCIANKDIGKGGMQLMRFVTREQARDIGSFMLLQNTIVLTCIMGPKGDLHKCHQIMIGKYLDMAPVKE